MIEHSREHERARRRERVADVGERLAHGAGVGIAITGLYPAGAIDHRGERSELLGRDQRPLRARGEHADRGVGRERDPARHRLDEHQRQRIHVGPRVELHTRRLLRGRVRAVPTIPPAGSVQLASASARASPKSATRDDAVLVEQEVGRLDVAMQHIARVRVLQRRRDVATDAGRLGDGQQRTLIEHRPEAAALQELEHHERHVVLAPVVDRDDVGVVQRRGELRLGPEPSQECRVVGQRGVEHLHRDLSAQPLVVGDVDAAARAGTDRTVQQVTTGEHPARKEVARNTSRHPTHGTGTDPCARVTARRCETALSGRLRRRGVPKIAYADGTVRPWRCVDRLIQLASHSLPS